MILPRENPFRAARISAVPYRFAPGLSWSVLFERWKLLGYRGAVVGPEGCGKTTLLEEFFLRLREMNLRARLLNAGSGAFDEILLTPPAKTDFLLVDSAERFSRIKWSRFKWMTRNAGGIIVTSHRPGFFPTLLECQTTPELFEQIVRDLLNRDAPSSPPIAREELRLLFTRHRGNIRTALRELYDRAARSCCTIRNPSNVSNGSTAVISGKPFAMSAA